MAYDPLPLDPTEAPASANAYFRAVPVSGVDGGDTTPTFTDLAGSVGGISGANLQAILEDIATRLAAAEA